MSARSPRLHVELSRAADGLPRDVRDELVEALFAMTEAEFPGRVQPLRRDEVSDAFSCVGWIRERTRTGRRDPEQHHLRPGVAQQGRLHHHDRAVARPNAPVAPLGSRLDVAPRLSSPRPHALPTPHPHLGTHPSPTFLSLGSRSAGHPSRRLRRSNDRRPHR